MADEQSLHVTNENVIVVPKHDKYYGISESDINEIKRLADKKEIISNKHENVFYTSLGFLFSSLLSALTVACTYDNNAEATCDRFLNYNFIIPTCASIVSLAIVIYSYTNKNHEYKRILAQGTELKNLIDRIMKKFDSDNS